MKIYTCIQTGLLNYFKLIIKIVYICGIWEEVLIYVYIVEKLSQAN
jgi:hypothetical protein